MPRQYLKLPEPTPQQAARFWAMVEVKTPDDCWPWRGQKEGKSKQTRVMIRRVRYITSRIAYFLHYAVDPALLHVCHRCDCCACCNPLHLFLGTQAENMVDMAKKGRGRKSQIDPSTRATIRQIYNEGQISQRQLAATYKISQRVVFDIVHHRKSYIS